MAMPRKGENRNCIICGKQFYADRARIKRGDALKYCSIKCKSIGKIKVRYKKICEYCGQEFKVTSGDIFRNKAVNFCSQGCWHSYCKIGNYYQRERNELKYKEWRLKVYERDNFTCQECGKSGIRLEAHHILPVYQYPHLIVDLENGITLCTPCHQNKDSSRRRPRNGLGRFTKILFGGASDINQKTQNLGVARESGVTV